MMPILVILAVIVAIYSVTRPGAIEGVKYFLIPNPKHFSAMDGCCGNGTDVLLPVNRDGNFVYIWFLYR